MRLSIKNAAGAFGLIVGLSFVSVIGIYSYALYELQVGGPIYQKIVQQKDLLADILPPPEYLVESYLEATLVVNEPQSLPQHRDRLAQLKKEYVDRLAYWQEAGLEEPLGQLILEKSAAPALRFWEIVEGQLLPAIGRSDMNAARLAYAAARGQYAAHRAAVDELVVATNAATKVQDEAAASALGSINTLIWLASGLALAIIAGGIGWLVLNVVRPMTRITKALSDLASGNLEIAIPCVGRRDELGAMASSAEVFQNAAIKARNDSEEAIVRAEADAAAQTKTAEALQSASEALRSAVKQTQDVVEAARNNDLTQRIPLEGKTEDIATLCSGINGLLDTMAAIITRITDSTRTISRAASEITSGNLDLSKRTEEQAAGLEETSASLEELTGAVRTNTENAQQARDLAIAASEVAVKGGDVVTQVVSTMDGISDASRKIAEIIGVIDEIAFQTNILALNAAVEAARAGEQGRGFAVVAAEVRNLAQRSADAAKEIKALISASVGQVESGSKLVESAGKTMAEIVQSVKRVTDIMTEISAASQEQNTGIEQVNIAVAEMDKITQQNAALVEQASAAATSMEDQTNGLETMVSVFKVGQTSGRPAAIRGQTLDRTGNPVIDSTIHQFASPARPSIAAHQPVKRRVAAAGGANDWQEF